MPNAKGTPNTPIRFTPEEKEKIKGIQGRHGLPSFAAAVRYACERYLIYEEEIEKIIRKKLGKKA